MFYSLISQQETEDIRQRLNTATDDLLIAQNRLAELEAQLADTTPQPPPPSNRTSNHTEFTSESRLQLRLEQINRMIRYAATAVGRDPNHHQRLCGRLPQPPPSKVLQRGH